ncbi:MAG: hypothetical protein H3Z53_11275 [archaeon]|nr:hypothetical protein [archaeon]MCP8314933.1 hypothetical protein [archaeon]
MEDKDLEKHILETLWELLKDYEMPLNFRVLVKRAIVDELKYLSTHRDWERLAYVGGRIEQAFKAIKLTKRIYSQAVRVTSARQQTSLMYDLQDIDQLILKGYQLSWKQFSPNWHPNIGMWCEEHSSRPSSEQTAIMLSGIIEYADEYRKGLITPENKAEILVGVGFILDRQRKDGSWTNDYLLGLNDPRMTGAHLVTLMYCAKHLPDISQKIMSALERGYRYIRHHWNFASEYPISTPRGLSFKAQTPLGAVMSCGTALSEMLNSFPMLEPDKKAIQDMLESTKRSVLSDNLWKNNVKWTLWITRFLVETLNVDMRDDADLVEFLLREQSIREILAEAYDHPSLAANYARTLSSLGITLDHPNISQMLSYLKSRWNDQLGYGGHKETEGVVRNLIKLRYHVKNRGNLT